MKAYPERETAARLYKKMRLIRRMELRIAEVYHTDVIKSPVHLSVGQEAVAAAVCDPLFQTDIVSNTYRCHATYIAKGGNLNAMMAELYGKKTGCAGGKAGSMHLVDMSQGVMGASAVVGTTIPVAAGMAYGFLLDALQTGQQKLVVSMFGDGATEEGCFYETLNFAALKKLPIIFVCENNRLAIHTPLEKRWATERLCERVATWGIPVHKTSDDDVLALHALMTGIAADVRKGKGPVFVECATYRWLEHVGPRDDHDEAYRNADKYALHRAGDQITALAGHLPVELRDSMDQIVEQELAAAEQFATESPWPAAEELYTHVYAS